MLRKLRLSIVAIFFAGLALAQPGSIKIHLTDKDTKEPILYATVVAFKAGSQEQAGGGYTDQDGFCLITPLDPGRYDVKVVYEGYNEFIITDVVVNPSQVAYPEGAMTKVVSNLKEVVKMVYHTPLISKKDISGQTIEQEDYTNMATKNYADVLGTMNGVVQTDVGQPIYFRGARSDATEYIVDGIKITPDQTYAAYSGGQTSVGGLPQGMIGQITAVTGGTPAKYGDVTGGVVEINTLNTAPKFFGNVQGITSDLFDKFGYNDAFITVGGPIWSTDTVPNDVKKEFKNTLIDFIVGAEITYQKDPNPSSIGSYHVDGQTLADIQENPLVLSPAGGVNRAAEYLNATDINHTDYGQNVGQDVYSVSPKISYHLTPNVQIILGGSYNYTIQHDVPTVGESTSGGSVPVYAYMNSTENPLDITNAYRGYIRLTQRFPVPPGKEKTTLIQNAYYSIQADYSNQSEVVENNEFKNNFFDYGFVGLYNAKMYPVYNPGLTQGHDGYGLYMAGFGDSALTFTPTSINPLEANYTKDVIKYFGHNGELTGNNASQSFVEENQGLYNGDLVNNVYSFYYGTGRAYPGYSLTNNDHFHFGAEFSATIKDNSIEVGFDYEQNRDSYYELNAKGLWTLMRLLTNDQFTQLDTAHPILVSQGTYNTYNYNYLYNAASQFQFDKSLRQSLGMPINGTNVIQTDNYLPSTYNLNMFSAGNLINNGNSYVTYYGYNYLGTLQSGTSSLNDFFNKTDANGNNTYPIAPFSPIYIAGYISDHFDIKSIVFDVGLRVDEFNANQPVLQDPYLFSPAKKVSELPSTPFEGQSIPSDIGSNYVVYVNNSESPTSIVGYRNGNNWYDANGNSLSDPSILAANTNSGTIQPYLENPNQTTVGSNAFTTFTPQVNVMPRLAFAFPITTTAQFFAHYDVLTQRPPGYGIGAGSDIFYPIYYQYIQDYTGGINNPALQPQQTIDYELGFTQVLDRAQSSSISISAYYRDMKSLVEAYRYYEAYPQTYITYTNIDYGTVKGLNIYYDLRRIGDWSDVKFRAGYTLQFADGTGSGPNSGINLANSGEPNLAIPQPLNFDQRHRFTANIDYHFSSGKSYDGPVITTKKGKSIQILSNAGINLQFTAGSGTPYSAQTNPTQQGISISQHYGLLGSINGSYLPWQYRLDARVDKQFPVKVKNHPCGITVYLQATNVLNTENVLNVFKYTGSATDDGFLASAQGQQAVATATSPQAYSDQYKIVEQYPSFFSLPRLLRLGLEFNF